MHLADDSALPFDGLVLATGSRPRRLPGQDAVPGSASSCARSTTRSRLRELIADGTARVVVVGAGFIGARGRGHGPGVAAAASPCWRRAEAPLIRGLGTAMGAATTTSHHDGVAIRCGVAVEAMRGASGVLLGRR